MDERGERTILVTGAAGFIGYHLAKRLLESGARVAGMDNLNSYYDTKLKEDRLAELENFKSFTFVRGDIADMGDVVPAFEKYRPHLVVNLAAQAGVRYSLINPRAYMESNVTGFFNMLEAVRRFPVAHFLYASSSSVYGNQEKTPFAVGDPVDRPISLYAATKLCDELLAYTYSQLYGIPVTGLRFFTVYGPFGRPDMAYFSFTKKILSGETIEVFNNGNLYRDFTYIDDVVTALERLLRLPPAPDSEGARAALYNIGGNRPEHLMRFVRVLENALGKKAEIVFRPMQKGDVYQTYADVTALERDVGFSPDTTIEKGLCEFVRWYRTYYSGK